jgi:hypothetical protein
MNTEARRRAFEHDGFIVVPEFLAPAELNPALAELPLMFPTPEEFHDNIDPARDARFRDEFGGITNFPFDSDEWSLLSVHPRVIELAEELLNFQDLRVYSIEAWAKFTGAASYEQAPPRDSLNHSLLVPQPDASAAQVEMFLYLTDVPRELGPPSYVPLEHTNWLPALPNWLPQRDGESDEDHPTWVSADAWPALYEHEVSAAGAAGTVVAYRVETFHRGTDMTAPLGARYTIHVNFRRADSDWITRRAWTDTANTSAWQSFVARASTRQLEVFGFPPPGHPYWNNETLARTAQRYPGFDVDRWRNR